MSEWSFKVDTGGEILDLVCGHCGGVLVLVDQELWCEWCDTQPEILMRAGVWPPRHHFDEEPDIWDTEEDL